MQNFKVVAHTKCLLKMKGVRRIDKGKIFLPLQILKSKNESTVL